MQKTPNNDQPSLASRRSQRRGAGPRPGGSAARRAPKQNDFTQTCRHPLTVRITHWINFVCIIILLMSGLGIFNGWPALYWGIRAHFADPLLAFYAVPDAAGRLVGMTWLFGHQFVTTGWFGLSTGSGGHAVVRGFPVWATLPGPLSLALARRWHFFFAWIFALNGLAYVAYTLASRHFWRDLVPSRQELAHTGRSVLDHLRLRFPRGLAAQRYNVLQKLSYIVVAFGLGPLMVATGLAMSPWVDAGYPWLLDVFGGRQSARTIHFVTAFAFLAFFLVHIAMVLASGPLNQVRAMITGRYRIEDKNEDDDETRPD